jgi:hypothetical protein
MSDYPGWAIVAAGVCVVAGLALLGLPVSASTPVRYFGGGILVGLALLLVIFGVRSF